MRIVAGIYGGRRITTPKGTETRPTSERVREALFSSLGDLNDLRCLDLFAGSGALGIEAISRGAAHGTFVERGSAPFAALSENLEALGIENATALRRDARSFLTSGKARDEAPFDLVFIDPPYRFAADLGPQLSAPLLPLLGANARVICEHGRREALHLSGGSLREVSDRRYGDSVIRTYSANQEGSEQ